MAQPITWMAVLVTGLMMTVPAEAVMRGEPARDPAGVRRSTVLIETPEGICTGAIVGPDLVLTAAHCVSARGRYRVRYLDRSFRRLTVAVARTMPHPNFDPGHGFAADDIGLIQVARPFAGDTRAATLPGGGWGVGWFSGGAPGEELLIAGFGSTERARGRDGILREALMRSAQPSVSGRGFAGLAGEERSQRPGMCVGDSGGPVYRREGRSFTVVGVLKGGTTDPGRECTSTPIYVPVRDYVPWIQSTASGWNTRVGGRGVLEMRQ
ncbi:S1 family peptidase [Phreatobacter sp.]|uniref:S1 family peptidase n=1 Tax=Phreatobacter sp. TaxID=1966341 RepID=UPI003F6F938A